MDKQYIERERAKEILRKFIQDCKNSNVNPAQISGLAHALYLIDGAPTAADVVEIKDCTQCKYFEKDRSNYPCSHCRNCYTDKFKPKEGV